MLLDTGGITKRRDSNLGVSGGTMRVSPSTAVTVEVSVVFGDVTNDE